MKGLEVINAERGKVLAEKKFEEICNRRVFGRLF